MSERFNAADVAVARRLRAVESANDATIRASAELIATMLDACEARSLPACAGHDSIVQMAGLIADAVNLRTRSLSAHREVAQLGTDLGLPVTAWGDACQPMMAGSNAGPARDTRQAA